MRLVRRIVSILLIALLALLVYDAAGIAVSSRRLPGIGSDPADAAVCRSGSRGGERVRLVSDNDEALMQRVRLIDAAQERIEFSTFAFKSDESGRVLLGALLEAARRGVQVQLVVDGVSGLTNLAGDADFYALSSDPNAEIRVYNPVNVLKPWKLSFRMHDKYIVCDDAAYLLGGRNSNDGFLENGRDGYLTYDWDVLVWNGGGGGDSLAQVETYFGTVWDSPDCRVFHDGDELAAKPRIADAAERIVRAADEYRARHPELAESYDYAANTLPAGKITLLSNPIGTGVKDPALFRRLLGLMASAQSEVRVHTPYIVFNSAMYDAFAGVCRQVPVDMMTNSAGNNANIFAAGDYAANREKILGTGISLMEFEGGRSYHGKCVAIDSDLSVVGSFNMDVRSAYLDTELMLVIEGGEVNADLRGRMASYEAEATTVLPGGGVDCPEGVTIQTGSAPQRAAKWAAHVFFGWARFLM